MKLDATWFRSLRHRADRAGETAAVLRHVLVRLRADGTMTISVDGQPLPEPQCEHTRLGQAIAAIAEKSTSPLRVEVHEVDGTIWADILTPPQVANMGTPDHATGTEESFSITYEGFNPDEEVLIAEVARTVAADQEGRVRVLAHQDSTRHRNVVIYGTVSGTIIAAGLA